jgi:predicted nucleotidyltransferase
MDCKSQPFSMQLFCLPAKIQLQTKGFSKVLMSKSNKTIPLKSIVAYCKKHPSIAKLSLFGSALSGSLQQDSDIDLLVEFEPGQTPSLFTIVAMEDELAVLLGRKADLRTAQDLSKYFRDDVVASARALYVKP